MRDTRSRGLRTRAMRGRLAGEIGTAWRFRKRRLALHFSRLVAREVFETRTRYKFISILGII
jgi:hypothetical protein